MDRAIACVTTHVLMYDYETKSWENLSRSNRNCRVKVLERGRRQYFINIVDEGDPKNAREFSLSEKCKVSRTQRILQIPVASIGSSPPLLLGMKFSDQAEETQFLLRVGEYIEGFKLSHQNTVVQNTMETATPTMAAATPSIAEVLSTAKPRPGHGYIAPAMPPSAASQHNFTHYISPDELPVPTSRQALTMAQYQPRPQYQPKLPNQHYGQNMEFQDYLSGQAINQPDDYRGQHINPRPAPVNDYGHGHQPQNNPRLMHIPEQNGHRPGNEIPPIKEAWVEPGNYGYQKNAYSIQNHQYMPLKQATPPSRPRMDHVRPMPARSMGVANKSSKAESNANIDHFAKRFAHMLSLPNYNKQDVNNLTDVLLDLLADERRSYGNGSEGMFVMSYVADKEVSQEDNKKFSLSLTLERYDGVGYPLYLDVTSLYTIEYLKIKVWELVKMPKECQTWIYGTTILEDKQTLKDMDITEEGAMIYIYVQHPKKVKGLTSKTMDQLKGVGKGHIPAQHEPVLKFEPKAESIRHFEHRGLEPVNDPVSFKPHPQIEPHPSIKPHPQIEPHPQVRYPQENIIAPQSGVNDPNRGMTSFYRGEQSFSPNKAPPVGGVRIMPSEMPRPPPIVNPSVPPIQQDPPITAPPIQQDPPITAPPIQQDPPTVADPPEVPVGWECTSCTFRNKPYRPGCAMCDSNRPEGYVPPPDYVMTEDEKKFVDQSKQGEILLQKLFHEEKEKQKEVAAVNYKNYIQTDDQPIVTNTEEFECSLCCIDMEPGEGLILRNCLHKICKDCLRNSVTNSEHVQIKCPVGNGCEECISDREIRAVLSDEELEALYNRGLRQAEAAARDSFHCQTTDCPGFCFYEDEVNEYKCLVCNHLNCILCKAQHEGMNCQQYQDDLKIKAANDEAAQQTKAMLEKMVTDGEAMHCPQCRVIVTKKQGCDWIKCTVCRTEMCWATKGPRWGPNGRGDTSGGCRCGINRKRCHPNCRNCH